MTHNIQLTHFSSHPHAFSLGEMTQEIIALSLATGDVRSVIIRHPAPSLNLLTFRNILLLGATTGGWWEDHVVVML